MNAPPLVRPVGECAVTLELGEGVDPATSARVRALDAALWRPPVAGVVETVPTFRALLVIFDPLRVSAAEVADTARARLHAGPALDAPPAVHEVPVRYGGEDGPDLLDVARATGLDPRRVVELHAGREYTAFMLGFVPGFAYLGPLPPELGVGRRATPRTRVPAGAVAIASGQTAVYPAATPGGWHLIGRTTVSLFDPRADPPALIRPGDRVRFVAVETLPARQRPRALAPSEPAAAVVEVVEAGLLTTVQDAGRTGFRRWGVGAAGAMDERALFAANHAAGNAGDAAVLECTVAGPALRFVAARHFAVAGADLGAVLHRADLGSWHVPLGVRVRARAGNVLAFGAPRRGCRAYVALAGGLDVPLVMGSRSTDLAGGFGGLAGRPLRAGDRLGAGSSEGAASAWRAAQRHGTREGGFGGEREGHRERNGRRPERSPRDDDASPPPAVDHGADAVVTLRAIPGPQDHLFTPEALEEFFSAEYRVRATSDRVGCRLEGPALAHSGAAEIASDGMLPGCVQVPPDGQPIVMGADSPTTGGYPKIATVIRADRARLAQLVPGQSRVRFVAVTVADAVRAIIGG